MFKCCLWGSNILIYGGVPCSDVFVCHRSLLTDVITMRLNAVILQLPLTSNRCTILCVVFIFMPFLIRYFNFLLFFNSPWSNKSMLLAKRIEAWLACVEEDNLWRFFEKKKTFSHTNNAFVVVKELFSTSIKFPNDMSEAIFTYFMGTCSTPWTDEKTFNQVFLSLNTFRLIV